MLATAQKYQRISEIASGGMATVYLGRTTAAASFERLVALKVMHPHLAREDEYVAMFLDEARLAARIRHPNVVATLDVVDDDVPFLVMELVEGPTLRMLMGAARKHLAVIPHDVALRIVTDTLLGLHAAHVLTDNDGSALRMVHRDVSPQNVLVGIDGISRIADFGVARAAVRLSVTQSGNVKGKIHYMAPEQVTGDSVDCRADVYAAGALLWEVLVGERRLKGEGEVALMYEVVQAPVVGPIERNADIPPELDEVCRRALMRDPAHRYPSAAAFADAIEHAAHAIGCGIATQRGVAKHVAQLDIHLKPDVSGSGSFSSTAGRAISETRRRGSEDLDGEAAKGTGAEGLDLQVDAAATGRRKRLGLGVAVVATLAAVAGALIVRSPAPAETAETAETAVETDQAVEVGPTAAETAPSAAPTLTTSATRTTSSAEIEATEPSAAPVAPPPTPRPGPKRPPPKPTDPVRPGDFQPTIL